MKLSRLLLREKSYNNQHVSRNRIDYGGFYYIKYEDEEGDTDDYVVFVINPNYDGKVHCLDLDKVDPSTFNEFFAKVRMEDEEEIRKMKLNYKGYVKRNIRIGNRFYDNFIKPNKRLMKDHPYKTLKFENINSARYIAYDIIIDDED